MAVLGFLPISPHPPLSLQSAAPVEQVRSFPGEFTWQGRREVSTEGEDAPGTQRLFSRRYLEVDLGQQKSLPSPNSCTVSGDIYKSDSASQVSKADFSIHSDNRHLLNIYYMPGTLHVRCQDVIEEGVAPFCRWGKSGPGSLSKLLLGGRARQIDS